MKSKITDPGNAELYTLTKKLVCNNCEMRTICAVSHLGFNHSQRLYNVYSSNNYLKSKPEVFMTSIMKLNTYMKSICSV